MALQKITEVAVDSTVTSANNPTFYIEKSGAFKRVTAEKMKELVAGDVGDLTSLNTTAKTSVVDAVNEVVAENSQLKSHLEAIGFTVVDGAVNITYEEG